MTGAMRTLVLGFLLCAAPVFAQGAQQRVLVQRVEPIGVDKELARSVEESLVFELGKRKAIEVVSPAELEQTVEHAQLQSELGCDWLDACMLEARDKLRVQRVITGKVSRLGDTYLATFGVVDLRTKSVGKRVAQSAKDFPGLLAAIPSTLDELLGTAAQRAPEFRLASGEHLKLAVMPLTARGVPAPTADAMTQILASELNHIEGISVISRDDIRALLDKVATEGELGCTDNLQCIVEIGASFGLSKLVTGSVGKLKDTYVIALQLIDTRRASVENRVLETFDGDADELRHAIKLSSYQLTGVDYKPRKGSVDFTFNVEHARVHMGERDLQIEHNRLAVHDLTPGRYSLRVLADPADYYPLQTDIYVAPSADNVRTFRVSDKPSPWYERWWVWTAAGVVVAAAVTGALLATQSAPSTQPGEVVLAR